MGSWSETCFVTHLPIPENNARIVGVPVIPATSRSAVMQHVSQYMFVGPPVRGIYDSYGGIEIDPDELHILEPLRESIRESLSDISYRDKDRYRASLRGITGIEEYNRQLHEGEPLPEDEQYEERLTRQFVFCGESSWLKFTPDEDDGGHDLYYPVSWLFAHEAVYDYMVAEALDSEYAMPEKAVLDSFDALDNASNRDRSTLQSLVEKAGLDNNFLEAWDRLSEDTPFRRWAMGYCWVSSLDHLSIEHFLKAGIPLETQHRFHELVHFNSSLFRHRIPWSDATGPQFGDWKLHQAFHEFCLDLLPSLVESD